MQKQAVVFSLGFLSVCQLAGGLLNPLVLSCAGFKQCWRDFSCFTDCESYNTVKEAAREGVCEKITVLQQVCC